MGKVCILGPVYIFLCVLKYLSIFFGLGFLVARRENLGQRAYRLDKEYFIENKGQWPSEVLYVARMRGLDAWITRWGVNYTFYKVEREEKAPKEDGFRFGERERNGGVLIGHWVLYEFQNPCREVTAQGRGKLLGYHNYLIGNDPSRHASYVGLYKEVVVKGIYEGIDIRYYFEGGKLRYDFVVHSGAQAEKIAFAFRGSDKTYVDEEERLVFTTRFGQVRLMDLRC